MYSAQEMKNKFNMMANLMGEADEEDEDQVFAYSITILINLCLMTPSKSQDSIKEAFLETNPYLLGLTFVVSIVHSIFEFLAFKNGKAMFLSH